MSADANQGTKPWHDPERLEELYHEKGKSISEVAGELGCSYATIQYFMDKYGIDRRQVGFWGNPSRLRYDNNAGMVFRSEGDRVSIHRLLAVAEYGFEEVCGSDVFHRNGVKWDNRPSNILIDETYEREEMLEWIDLFVSEFRVCTHRPRYPWVARAFSGNIPE